MFTEVFKAMSITLMRHKRDFIGAPSVKLCHTFPSGPWYADTPLKNQGKLQTLSIPSMLIPISRVEAV